MKNVSPKTLAWYRDVGRVFATLDVSSPQAIKASLRDCIRAQLEKGVKPVSVNSWLTGIRAYLLWLWADGCLKERPKVELLKCEQKVIPTMTKEQVSRFIAYRPKGRNESRAHIAACVMLDCGLRLSEALSLERQQVDLDNLVLRVKGKGSKERLVPISVELRKRLFRWMRSHQRPLLFGTRVGTRVTNRNYQRDLKQLAERAGLGVHLHPHGLRHTMAVMYLRNGGNLFYLAKILGHTSVKTTERYLRSVQVEDLSAVHDKLSLLTR